MSSDKWVSTCPVFLEMANDYLEYVASYRVGDAVIVEYGYQKHTSAWEIMGYNKYVKIHWRQQEVLYRNNPFSRLQECRNNRFVRRCDANTGKRCVCQDEFLEHGNRFFSTFPMPKTLESFANQSLYVGVGLMCKNFCDTWYTSKFKGDKPADYTRSVASGMTPEKKLLYEVFVILQTHAQKSRDKPTKTYVVSIKDRISTELRRDVLERAMKETPKTSADEILDTLSATYQESIYKESAVHPAGS